MRHKKREPVVDAGGSGGRAEPMPTKGLLMLAAAAIAPTRSRAAERAKVLILLDVGVSRGCANPPAALAGEEGRSTATARTRSWAAARFIKRRPF